MENKQKEASSTNSHDTHGNRLLRLEIEMQKNLKRRKEQARARLLNVENMTESNLPNLNQE